MKNINKIFKNGAIKNIKSKFGNKLSNRTFLNISNKKTMNFRIIGTSLALIGSGAYMNRDLFFLDAQLNTQISVSKDTTELTAQIKKEKNSYVLSPIRKEEKINPLIILPAGFLKRFLAALIDVSIAFSITIVGGIVSFALFPPSIVVVLPVSIIVSSLTLFFNDAITQDETYKVSRSVGKMVMGIVPLKYENSQVVPFTELFIHSLVSSLLTQVTFVPDLLLLLCTDTQMTCADRILGIYYARQY
eukprot:TRINITY_DN5197_c0_g1_i1.p1 TRINITY_DN5197_c0_g1~~TRINITY_DN5197_c0_g1_i1.p1  ORF type:complete len:246 (+),score=48.66 TRINITY_DN5197_c0_g1_i1:1-738(+)